MAMEETIWSGHPSHWRYFWSWVFILILAAAAVGLAINSAPPGAVLAAAALALILIFWVILARRRRTYTVTTIKVVAEWGLFAKSSDEVRVQDIRSISVRRRGLVGLFGVGDVEFATAAVADGAIVFREVSGATRVRDLVRKCQLHEPANRSGETVG
jgi:uncharacterized membrane protein YdbT with pleckstrin-like domain